MSETKPIYAHIGGLPVEDTINVPAIQPDTASRIRALRRSSSQPIEIWQPVDGECLAGLIIGGRKAAGPYGEGSQAIIQDDEGKVWALWLTTWLAENFRLQGAEIGDLCAVTFLGKKQSAFGRTFNAYSLAIEKAGSRPDNRQRGQ